MLFCQNSIYKYFVVLGSFNDCLIWTPLQKPPGLQMKMKTNIPWKNMEVKESSIPSKPVHAVIRITKCQSRLDCLIFETLFIKGLNPKVKCSERLYSCKTYTDMQMSYSIPYSHTIASVPHQETLWV